MNYRDFKPYSKISSLTLGGGGIGQVWGETTSEEAIKTVHSALDHGINHFDVAPMYGKGEAERIIGKSLNGLDADDFLGIYRINVVGGYQMVRAARPHLKASGDGSVVNVSSIAGVMGTGSCIAYAASKGAVNTMTLSLARALGPEIRVNTVCPGFVQGS